MSIRFLGTLLTLTAVMCVPLPVVAIKFEFNPEEIHRFSGNGPYLEKGFRFEEIMSPTAGGVGFGDMWLGDWNQSADSVITMVHDEGALFTPRSMEVILSPSDETTIRLSSSKGGVRDITSDEFVELSGPLWEDISLLEIRGTGCGSCTPIFQAEGLIYDLEVDESAFIRTELSVELIENGQSVFRNDKFEIKQVPADLPSSTFTGETTLTQIKPNEFLFSAEGSAAGRYALGSWNLLGEWDVSLNTNEPEAILKNGLLVGVKDKFRITGGGNAVVPAGPMTVTGKIDFEAVGSLLDANQSIVVDAKLKTELSEFSFDLNLNSQTGIEGEFNIPSELEFSLPIPIDDRLGNFDLSFQADIESKTVEQVQLDWQFDIGRTITIESITFSDGTTPESLGFDLDFDSGFTSPNIPQPQADFDADGDTDGNDFLTWQRAESPNSLSQADLAIWQAQYGSMTSATTAIPEPTTFLLAMLATVGACCYRRKN